MNTAGTLSRRVYNWIDDRLGLSALRYNVPVHANTFWYVLGGITFIGLLVLAATGFWLAQYYNPDPAGARESVLYIQNTAPLGNIIRGIHVWTAYLVVITSVLHMIRIVVTASYKIPREINWLIGLAMLIMLLFGSVFSGTVLRWDQEAYEALTHNLELAFLLGPLRGFLSDAFTSSVSMLPRVYIVHVSILPLILFVFLVVHMLLIKHHGISPTPAQSDVSAAPDGKLPKEKLTSNYTTHLRLLSIYGVILVLFVGTLSVLFPQEIGPAPNPQMEVTKPPFLFYWLYAFEDWFGVTGILYAGGTLFGLLALLPFLDRTPLRSLRRRPVVAVIGALLLLVILVSSIMVATAPAVKHME